MSWKTGSLDPPRKSLPKRVGVLRRSRNNPSLNGSILDDNSVVDSNKRESQWWKRLNSEDKNSTADFFPMSNINIDLMDNQINIQPQESTAYQSNNEEDDVSFSTISSLNLSLSTRPLFKKGGHKNSSLEMNQTLGNFKYRKTLFNNMATENRSVNYNLANLSPTSPDSQDFQDENDDDEILKEPIIKNLFNKPEKWIKNGRSAFADESSNHTVDYESKHVNYDSEDSVSDATKKSLFEKGAEENVETMSVLAEGLVNEIDSPSSRSIEYASGNFLNSILSGGEKRQKLFKMTVERPEPMKFVCADAPSNDYESDKSSLHSLNEKSEKSIEIKKSLFKNSSRKNVDYKSVFARALTSNSDVDIIQDLCEPDLKKQKFSENEAMSNTNIGGDPHLNDNTDYESDLPGLLSVNDKSENSIEIKKSLVRNADRKNGEYKSVFAQALTSNSERDTNLDLPEPDLKKQKFSENAVIVSNTNIDFNLHPDTYTDYELDKSGLQNVNAKPEKSLDVKKSLFKNVDYKSMFAQALTRNSGNDTILNLPVVNLEKQSSEDSAVMSNTNINVAPHLDVIADYESDMSSLHSVNEKSEKSIVIKKSLFKNASRKNVDYKTMFAQVSTSNSETETNLDLPAPCFKNQFSDNAIIVSNTNISTVPNLDVNAAEQVENIYSSKTNRKSSLYKSRRQSDNDGLSMKSGNSPMSITSETMNFDMWKQVASSTMMESPQTPRRDNARASRNLLPVRSLKHPDISEEKESSTVTLPTKNDSKVIPPIRDQTIEGIIQLSCENNAQFASGDNLISKEITKNMLNTSITCKENINDENNTSITRRSKRNSKKNDSLSKSFTIKDLGIDEIDENHLGPVRNAKQSHEPAHLIEKEIQDVESSNTEKFPEPRTFEMSKRQSVGTWLKLQESEVDTVPILNQSYIDKQVMEEIMAKRTNPPVRRSTYDNFNINNSTSDKTLACDEDGSSSINKSTESQRKKYTVRHSNASNLATHTDDPQMEAIVVTPLESPPAVKDVSNKIDSKNRSSTRSDEDHVSSSSLIKIGNESKKESLCEAISTEVIHFESELKQNAKFLSDDQIADDENIFTPKKFPEISNVQNEENSTIHDSDMYTAGLTDLDVPADTFHDKNKERSLKIQQTDMSHSNNNSALGDSANDSESYDDASEALFDVKDLVETNQKNKVQHQQETVSPILLEASIKKTEVNHSQKSKRLTETVSTSKKTVNNKENAPPIGISQTDIIKHLEKLELGNLQRNKKAEEFSKQYLARKIVYLKPSAEKNELTLKLNKNHGKRTTSKVILDKRETGMNSKKRKNKPKPHLKEHWVTSYLRSFVEKKLKLRYGFESNVRTEKFIKDLVQIVKLVEDAKSAYHQHVDTLKIEMAKLEIVKTHFEFYRFVQVYLPYYFRIRSIPSCDRSVPNLKEGLFTDIVIDDKE